MAARECYQCCGLASPHFMLLILDECLSRLSYQLINELNVQIIRSIFT